MFRLGERGILSLLVALMFVSFTATSVHAIGISFLATSESTLEDAILITSVNGDPPRDAVALGDFDLSTTATGNVVDVAVDPATTHWWLIGHEGSNVVYSSNQNLNGVDMYSVEPYIGAELAWNIPANLAGFVNGTGYSMDWWAQTCCNHHSHVAGDEQISQLWLFASPGNELGYVSVSIHTNTPPPVPEPGTLSLLAIGGLALVRRRWR